MTMHTLLTCLLPLRHRWARRRAAEHALRRFMSRRQALRIARLIP
jgi:hypothetical protein